jgi:hypothetical protein
MMVGAFLWGYFRLILSSAFEIFSVLILRIMIFWNCNVLYLIIAYIPRTYKSLQIKALYSI